MVALVVSAAAFGAGTTYQGYLCDKACATSGKLALDGADLQKNPGEHTVACMVACAQGGYGLLMKDGATYKFVPFSGKGNEQAAALLKTTARTKEMSIEVTGEMKGDSLEVAGMTETGL
jgi:hypothetical protein